MVSGNFQFLSLRSSSSRPMRVCLACSSRRNDLILLRAFDVTTKLSQSDLGVWFFWVRISTMSPLRSCSRIDTARLLTLPPTHVEPRLGVDVECEVQERGPFGQFPQVAVGREDEDLARSGFGVEALRQRVGGVFEQFAQAAQPDFAGLRALIHPLERQCAAMPRSATASMRSVRICTSTQRPSADTVVCSDS